MKYLYETHLHTSHVSACSRATSADHVKAYKRMGYAGIIVTDHFVNGNSSCPRNLPWNDKMRFIVSGYEKAKIEGDKCGLDVFLGWEYVSGKAEYLTYGLGLDFLLAHPQLGRMIIEDYSALVRRHGGYIAQSHPFRVDLYFNSSPAEPSLLDGFEVYNASMPDKFNEKAFAFANLHNLPMQAGSDAHTADGSLASGIILKKKATDIFDIIKAIKSRQTTLILPEHTTLQNGFNT